MFERFCPNIHGICKDGYPDNNSHLCVFWDSLGECCTMAKSAQLTADGYQLMNQSMKQRIEDEEEMRRKAEVLENEPQE